MNTVEYRVSTFGLITLRSSEVESRRVCAGVRKCSCEFSVLQQWISVLNIAVIR